MGRKNKRSKKPKKSKQPKANKVQSSQASSGVAGARSAGSARSVQPEPQSSVAVTVAWLVTAMATIGSLGLAITCDWLQRATADQNMMAITAMLWFISLVCGIVVLGLTPVVLKIRDTRPPASVTRSVLIVGLLPGVALLVRWWLAP